jgi:hypothetical protein
MFRLATIIAIVLVPTFATAADKLETTHLFGFTLGTDVNDVGETEGELESVGRFGKRGGSYAAMSTLAGIKAIPFKDFSIEPGIGFASHNISGVPGLDDRRQFAFESFGFETRYRLLDRAQAPFGLTLGADPRWSRLDDISGEHVDRYGSGFLAIVDKELVADRVFAAVNLLYELEASRSGLTNVWEHQSSIGVTAALAVQVESGMLIGAEARYLRSYDGLGLDAFTGHALFIGPTFYRRFNARICMGAAWSVQVAGRAVAVPGALDLVNFERQQATVRFGYNF